MSARAGRRGPRSVVDSVVGAQAMLVAGRELRERGRSKVFGIGLAVLLAGVAAAILVPAALRHGPARLRVGLAGSASQSAAVRSAVASAARSSGVRVRLVAEPGVAAAKRSLRAGRIDVAVAADSAVLVDRAVAAGSTSAGAELARALAAGLGLQRALVAAGIPPARAAELARPTPLPVIAVQPPPRNSNARTAAIYGTILLYALLSQFGAWILMGVVEEKSSRVVEVLLAAVRPVQLLTGKVLGLGLLVALQAALIVAVALGLGAAVGSDLLSGAGPLEVLSALCWLLLGYVLYCWIYAAAGSLADRQEHLQSLAFPLQLPILAGYLVALLSLGSPTPSMLVRVLAYLPPTAPFCMPVLVADGAVSWWAYTLSCLATIAATFAVARVAVAVFERAVLRRGRRVRLGEVLGHTAAAN